MAKFPVSPLIPQKMPDIYASFFASPNTSFTLAEKTLPSVICEL
jgi:hypothetical protein